MPVCVSLFVGCFVERNQCVLDELNPACCSGCRMEAGRQTWGIFLHSADLLVPSVSVPHSSRVDSRRADSQLTPVTEALLTPSELPISTFKRPLVDELIFRVRLAVVSGKQFCRVQFSQ